MTAMTGSVELFLSPYCRCSTSARRQIRNLVRKSRPDVEWSEVNVLDDLERAVARGVRSTPAIAVNGHVVTSGKLDLEALREALEADHDRQHR